jgi:type III pantothenate kinase
MIICFDAGNTRLKWGLADADGWHCLGALEWARLAALPARLATLPPFRAAWLASVADRKREAALLACLPEGVECVRVESSAAAGGVRNGYRQPARLGVDRWCALIGARQRERRACLVVCAGTATTIDSLDAEGRFLGGLILPGLLMMQNALAGGTAGLPRQSGAHALFPRETGDAIQSGCLEAQVGAITRAFARLPGAAACILSGGAAASLRPLLDLPVVPVEYLVLEGVRHLALAGADA